MLCNFQEQNLQIKICQIIGLVFGKRKEAHFHALL